MTTNLLTTITNTLVSVFIFAIFPVFCDADRQETASDVNVAGMVLIPADDMPQWLMHIGLASGYRQKPSGKDPHVAVSSARLKPSTLQMAVLKMSSIISKASSVDFGASRHFPINSLWAGGIRIMKLKFGSKTIDLRRVRRIVKVGDSLAKVYFHTGDTLLVRCSVRYPDGMTFTYPGTIEELHDLLRRKKLVLRSPGLCYIAGALDKRVSNFA